MPSITISDEQISWSVRLSSSKFQVEMIHLLHQVLSKILERRGKRDLQLKLHHHHTTHHASCCVCFDRTRPGHWRRRIMIKSADNLCRIPALLRRSQSAKNSSGRWRCGAAVLLLGENERTTSIQMRQCYFHLCTTILRLFRGWEGRMYCYNWVIMERWSYITRKVECRVMRIASFAVLHSRIQ